MSADDQPERRRRWSMIWEMPLFKKILVSLLRILAGVPIVGLLAGGLLLLVLGTTLKGRIVGLSVAIFGGILFCSVG